MINISGRFWISITHLLSNEEKPNCKKKHQSSQKCLKNCEPVVIRFRMLRQVISNKQQQMNHIPWLNNYNWSWIGSSSALFYSPDRLHLIVFCFFFSYITIVTKNSCLAKPIWKSTFGWIRTWNHRISLLDL